MLQSRSLQTTVTGLNQTREAILSGYKDIVTIM